MNMHWVIKGESRLYKKTVNHSCQYEVVGTLRKRNFFFHTSFVPDL